MDFVYLIILYLTINNVHLKKIVIWGRFMDLLFVLSYPTCFLVNNESQNRQQLTHI